MIKTSTYNIAIAGTFLWIGFVCAISFMEASVKFRAPGVSIATGLSIGKLVFHALNRMEWVLAIVIAINLMFNSRRLSFMRYCGFIIPFFILLLQTSILLPALDLRADLYIKGEQLPVSYMHIYYVAAEVIKIVTLIYFGYQLLRNTHIYSPKQS